MNDADRSVLADIAKALELLRGAASDLDTEADRFYELGDNWRGNIRHDAGYRLLQLAESVQSATSHLPKALEK